MRCNFKLIILFTLLLFFTPNVSAWYDNNYSSKTEFNISGTGNAVFSLNVSNSTGIDNKTWKFCDGKCNSNFSDIFFTYNDQTPVPFEIENATGVNSTTALVWIKITAGTESYPHQMYFEDSDAVSAANGNNTWTIYDNFTNGTTLNTSLWDVGGTGSASVADGNLTLIDKYYIRSKTQYSSGYFMRARVRMGVDADDHAFVGFLGSISYDLTKMNALKYDTDDNKFFCVGGHDSVGYVQYPFTATYSVTAWELFEYRRGGTADYCKLVNDSNVNYEADHFHPTRYSTHDRWLMAQAWTSDLIVDWIKMGPYNLSGPTWGTYGQPISGHVTYVPPTPIAGTRTNGTGWTNYTWSAGSGNVTDQYNVCVNLISCTNQTAPHLNTTLTAHQWNNISIKAINTSNNTMNATEIRDTYQNPNTAPVLGLIGNKKIYQDKTINIQLSASDTDGDNVSTWYTFQAENYTDYASVGWAITYNILYSGYNAIYNETAPTGAVIYNFNGTDINLTYVRSTGRGIMNVSIDGGANTSIDEYGVLEYKYPYNFSLDLTPGEHNASLYHTGTKNGLSSSTRVSVDSFQVESVGWYGTNASKGSLNNTTGLFTWTPGIADVGNYTWYFNYTDGWGGVDSETITVQVKANRLINVSLYDIGWQAVLVNDTQTFLSLDTLLSPTYLAWWNGTSQEWHKYKSGWLYRQNESISSDNAVYVLVSADSTKSLNISHSYNYTLHTGQNLIGFPENITMSTINTSVNVDGNCTNVDEINYNYPTNLTLATYSCVSGSNQSNASVIVEEGRGAWVNAVRNVTILDALG